MNEKKNYFSNKHVHGWNMHLMKGNIEFLKIIISYVFYLRGKKFIFLIVIFNNDFYNEKLIYHLMLLYLRFQKKIQ